MLTDAGRRLAKRYKVRFLSTCPSHGRKHDGDTDPWDRTDDLWPPPPKRKKEREKREGEKEGGVGGHVIGMPGQT
jgi:hypothetical protein